MSFHPSCLTVSDLESLLGRFEAAMVAVAPCATAGVERPALLAYALGHATEGSDGGWAHALERARLGSPTALSNTPARALLWRLLASQMAIGVATYEALGALQSPDLAGAVPQELASIAALWQRDMEEGKAAASFFFLVSHLCVGGWGRAMLPHLQRLTQIKGGYSSIPSSRFRS